MLIRQPLRAMFLLLLLILLVAGLATFWLTAHVREQHPPIGQFITVNGLQLHYLDSAVSASESVQTSDQPVLVLLHGATGNLQDYLASIYPQLAKQYRVIAFDRPGLGYSERPDGQWFDPHQQAQLVRAALQQLDIKQPILLGHSWSGALVLDYLVHYQQEVKAAILLSPVSHAWPNGVSWYNYIQGVPVLREILAYTILPIMGWLSADDGIREVFAPQAVPDNYRKAIALDLFFRPRVMLNNFQDLRLLNEFVTRLSVNYPEVAIPVQIISGTDDTVVSSWNHSQRLNRELQDVRWLDLPGTGHAPHHSHTDLVLETISHFTQQLNP